MQSPIPAEAYECRLVPSLFRAWAVSLVKLAELVPGERVLDVACGSGIVARSAAPEVSATGSVTGFDVDPEMLRVARTAAAGIVPSIEWCEGDALELPFGDRSFDVVFCQQGLQFFSDPVAAVMEMQRVLVPNGRLAVSVWRGIQGPECLAALATALERHLGPEALEETRAPCPFGDPEILRSLIVQAGLEKTRLSVVVEDLRSDSAEEFFEQALVASSLTSSLGGLDPGARARLIADLDQALRPWVDGGTITIPVGANVALAGT